MGIKDFNTFFKAKAPGAYRTFPASALSGHRIAIDGHNWMYSRIATIQKDFLTEAAVLTGELDRGKMVIAWIDACLKFNATLLTYGITPIWVFDGDYPPEKLKTKVKRVTDKKEARQKLDEQRSTYDNMDHVEKLNITPGEIQEMKKLMGRDTRVFGDEQEILRSTLEGIGLPCLRAYGEAEQLCSMLCLDGLASAVFSTDTDNLVYGAPLMISGFAKGTSYNPKTRERIHMFEMVHLPTLLTEANLPFNAFRDLCIVMKCDYNERIPKIGPQTAYKEFRAMLDAHGVASIDFITKWNVECLRAPTCRWLFMYRPYHKVISNTTMTDRNGEFPDFESGQLEETLNVRDLLAVQGRDVLEPIGLSHWLGKLSQIFPMIPKPARVAPHPIAEQVKALIVPDPKTLPPPSVVLVGPAPSIAKPVMRLRVNPTPIPIPAPITRLVLRVNPHPTPNLDPSS
jgi:5'-3' exonuclease